MAEYASKGVAGAGLGLGIAGTALGLLAGGLNGGNGLGGILGCNNCGCHPQMAMGVIAEKDAKIAQLTAEKYSDNQDAVVYKATREENKQLRDELFAYITPIANESASNRERVAVLESQIKCENEKALLREQLVRKDIELVAQQSACGISQLNGAVNSINKTLCQITNTIVPLTKICPQPMPALNTWIAPTTVAPTNVAVTNLQNDDCGC